MTSVGAVSIAVAILAYLVIRNKPGEIGGFSGAD